jgi:hypothetical protein
MLPNMTMSSAYDNIDQLPTISTFCLWVDSLMTFFKPILNSVGDKASPCRSPDLISNSDDSSPINFSLWIETKKILQYKIPATPLKKT